MDTRTDRRVNRTRRMLRTALKELILEKGYTSITVEEITDRADIGRTTFYLHYRDKEDLLLDSLDAISLELKEQVAQMMPTRQEVPNLRLRSDSSRFNPILVVFQHIGDNRDFYRTILSDEVAVKVGRRVRDFMSEAAFEFFTRRFPELSGQIKPKIPLEVVAAYYAGSLLELITWWMDHNMPYTAEEMVNIFRQLFFPGAWEVLGLPAEERP